MSMADDDIAPHASASPIDPTKNVLDLVHAQARFQEKFDGLALAARVAEEGWIVKYFEALERWPSNAV